MCRTLVEGGKRCAAHTRPRYEAATFGSAEWDRAAAEYAATPSGRVALRQERIDAENVGDLERTVALAHALSEGERLAATADAVREALSPEASLDERLASAEDSMRALADEVGYRRLVTRPDRSTNRFGTFVFQQGSRSVSVRYTAHPEGLVLHLKPADLYPDRDHNPIVEWEHRARWDEPEAMAGLTGAVRTVLQNRKAEDPANAPAVAAPPAPATPAEVEDAFATISRDLGYTRVRITDVPDGVSRYVDFLRPKPQKSRRFRYYATETGWTARIRGRYPRLANRPQARQGDTDLIVSAAWESETDSVEALGVIRDLFDALG